ncbi:hypothetical protein [Corallococcus exiguus]|uniref:ArsR family transcriptional regulator n=1 Tax=Corallococcus exiguus TaxID=83462 RepID=A0A7X4YJ24_9BACT|nr:hypothetical protein [Corallococcus exiguus]NBC46253.1 hypothetical protein [Corallococcus exiguus]TNV61272.1 hypothetical protein FH620_21740 [Corallococcus exiguus]
MFEAVEHYRPHVIAMLSDAGPTGFTVKELRARLNAGEEVIRRTLTLLLSTGAVRESYRHTPGARGAAPRVYTLARAGDSTLAATSATTPELVVTK